MMGRRNIRNRFDWRGKKPRALFSIAILALLLCGGIPAASAGERLCVVDEAVPILEKPGGQYVIEDDGYVDGEDVMGIVVYGNHIQTGPVRDAAFADTWAELFDSEGGRSLGYVERKGLEPLPDYEPFPARFFIVRIDAPTLLLQPGATDRNGRTYRLSHWNYSLGVGEVVAAFGKTTREDGEWLLLGFSTSIEERGDSGIGMRYAWARGEDLCPLADYRPNHAKNEEAWMPAKMRNALFSYHDDRASERPSFEDIPRSTRERLLRDGFHIDREPLIPAYVAVDDMCDLYNDTGEYTVDFLTTDLFLHAYHLLFSRMLQKVEATAFKPALQDGLVAALAALDRTMPSLPEAMRESGAVARDMLTIPLALLQTESPPDLSPRAQEEIRRIMRAEGRDVSGITGATEDYSQYRPRGHYAGTPELESYFRAATFLGNAGLPLFGPDGKTQPKNVSTAILLVLALDSKTGAWDAYQAPVDFLIGRSDDGPYSLYRDIAREAIGTLGEAGKLAEAREIERVAEEIRRRVPAPRIRDRETGNLSKEEEAATRRPEFRLSGKRFTFDAYVLHQLTSPRVGTDAEPRNLPQGTDVMAVLGSKAARRYAARHNAVKHYAETLRRLTDEAGRFLDGDDTAYSRWLDVLRAGFLDSGSRQVFYRSEPWQWKKLSTASASWAELKHDTVLYAKQGGAEMGDGGWVAGKFAPPAPRGYVEPDPQTFAAILTLLDRLSHFLDTFSLEPAEDREYADKIETFRSLCAQAMRYAEREVREEALTLDDYDGIKKLARAFTAQLLLPQGRELEYDEWEKLRMALVTDVATDFFEGRVLHAATGTPRAVYVFVNDRAGGPRVAKGYVYSYYEFARPHGEGRMTDEEWRAVVYDARRADELRTLHSDWYEAFEAK